MKRLGTGLALLALPLVEIALLIAVGRRIGLWPTLGIVFGTAVLGFTVLVRQRFAVIGGVMKALDQGRQPLAPVVDGAFLVLAGGLLISPGLVCDVAGLLLLVPQVRHLIAGATVSRMMRDMGTEAAMQREEAGGGRGGQIIEGEFSRVDERDIRGSGSGPERR